MTKEFAGYAFQKTLATGLIDMALLLANASQLKIIVENEIQEPSFKSVCSMVFVIASILLQVFVGCLLIYLGSMEKGMSNGVVHKTITDHASDNNSNNKRRTHHRENEADSISATSELKSGEYPDNSNHTDSSIEPEIGPYPEVPDYSDSSSQTNGEFNKRQGKRHRIIATNFNSSTSELETREYLEQPKHSNSLQTPTVDPNPGPPEYASSSAQTKAVSNLDETSDHDGASINDVSTDERDKNDVDYNGNDRVQVDLDSLDGFYRGELRYVNDRSSPFLSREIYQSKQSVRIQILDSMDAEEGDIESLGDQRRVTDMIPKNHSKANMLTKYCVFIIVVVNIFISVMGVGPSNGMTGQVVLNGS